MKKKTGNDLLFVLPFWPFIAPARNLGRYGVSTYVLSEVSASYCKLNCTACLRLTHLTYAVPVRIRTDRTYVLISSSTYSGGGVSVSTTQDAVRPYIRTWWTDTRW
ncbi:hypothetical protein GGS21DRAFT_530636 [Xylaria nigripes]|nr:hypothetical protein GGS21DRAFT_530636 [Xylaria nigripes]